MIVTTKSGTKYRIDLKAKTWERLSKTEHSGTLRTESGVFDQIEGPDLGRGMTITCPPLTPRAYVRIIYTTPVVGIEDESPENGQGVEGAS